MTSYCAHYLEMMTSCVLIYNDDGEGSVSVSDLAMFSLKKF
jgi:hypothetical protein